MIDNNKLLSYLRIPASIIQGLIFILRYVYEYDTLYEYMNDNWNISNFPLSELGFRNRNENTFSALDLFFYQIDPFILLLLIYNTWNNITREEVDLLRSHSAFTDLIYRRRSSTSGEDESLYNPSFATKSSLVESLVQLPQGAINALDESQNPSPSDNDNGNISLSNSNNSSRRGSIKHFGYMVTSRIRTYSTSFYESSLSERSIARDSSMTLDSSNVTNYIWHTIKLWGRKLFRVICKYGREIYVILYHYYLLLKAFAISLFYHLTHKMSLFWQFVYIYIINYTF